MKTFQQFQTDNFSEKASNKIIADETMPELQLIESELYNCIGDCEGTIRDMCSHLLKAGGKKIRPLLTMHWGQVFSGMNPLLLKAAVATELIHMASLIHDDIIDNSNLRRNKPSVNSLWGNRFAVLCGDYLFSRAFGILAANRLLKSLDCMVEAINNMCCGEIAQADFRFNTGLSVREYYRLIAMKTGVFLGCCCKSGAAVGGASDVQLKLAYDYGLNLGYAFQIVDDILDYFGKTEQIGKPKYEDLRQGGITLPVIFLLQDNRYGPRVREIIVNWDFTEENLADLTDMMERAGIRDKCMNIAALHVKKAKSLASLYSYNSHARELVAMADMVLSRTR